MVHNYLSSRFKAIYDYQQRITFPENVNVWKNPLNKWKEKDDN